MLCVFFRGTVIIISDDEEENEAQTNSNSDDDDDVTFVQETYSAERLHYIEQLRSHVPEKYRQASCCDVMFMSDCLVLTLESSL